MNQINVEGLCGALSHAKPGDTIKLNDYKIRGGKQMNLATEKRKIDVILAKDYDHETPDKPRSAEFQKAFKALLKKMFPNYTIIPIKGCWCEAHGFIKDQNGKFVYYGTNDYRWATFGRWDQRILIRTAESEKDYTGGANHTVDLDELEDQVNWLFKIQNK